MKSSFLSVGRLSDVLTRSSFSSLAAALLATLLLAGSSAIAGTPGIGAFTVGSATEATGGRVSLYAKNVTETGTGSIAGVRFYRESNGSSGLQTGSDTYVGLGIYANNEWTLAAPTTGLSGSQTYYAVALDTAGNASTPLSASTSVSGSGFSNWSTLTTLLAKVPLSIGYIASTSVVNFGTTVYTGPLDTTITLDRIEADEGPNRSGDGATFTNNGNPPLPTNRGSFYEFTINPQTGCSPSFTASQVAFPGPLRYMIDTSGDIYFTGDHYSTDRNLYIAGTPTLGSVGSNPSSTTEGTPITLTASNVSETISPAPNMSANTGSNVLATVTNVQFFLETNSTSGLQTDTDRLLGQGTANGSIWTLSAVSTTGLSVGTHTVYALAVDPAGNTAMQTATFTISAASTPPLISTQPASLSIASRQTAAFTAAATGAPAPTVQWQLSTDGGVSFSNVSNATTNTLSFPAALALSGNSYRAVFTNGTLPNATTAAATLTVAVPPGASTISRQTGGSFLLQFQDVAGYTYGLQYTPDLLLPWQSLGPVTIDASGLGQYIDTAHTGRASGFYRFVYP